MTPSKTLTETDAELAQRFADLTARLEEGTRHSSKFKTRLEHPAFAEIVAMGERAIPLLRADLEKDGGFVFLALYRITGVDPAPKPEVVGGFRAYDIKGMQAAWLASGRAQAYKW